MEKITIFTPTYNRLNCLHNLYSSLVKQSNKNFIWLIVDDGSTDKTKEKVEQWIREEYIDICYVFQENQGKHIAFNTGVQNCSTRIFFCVDSDDWLLSNAVDLIFADLHELNNDDIAGIISVKILCDGKVVGNEIPNHIHFSSLSELYEKHKIIGDKSLVYKTEILRRFPFPKFNGEKFVGEEYVYCQIDSHYKMYITQNRYYTCEYQLDGYSANMFRLIWNNPVGYRELKKIKVLNSTSIHTIYKQSALYIVGCILTKDSNWLRNSSNKIICCMSIPLAFIVYLSRFLSFDLRRE